MAYDLGVIIPVYRSTKSVRHLVLQIRELFLPDTSLQIYLVDDSGNEEIHNYLRRHCRFPEVTLLILKENSGQQAAILCALEHAQPCRYYATIDDDLEQPPAVLRLLYERARDGYDLIYGIPGNPGMQRYRRFGSHMRDLLFSGLLGAPNGLRVSSLRVMTNQVARDACSQKRNGFFYLSAAIFADCRLTGKQIRTTHVFYRKNPRRDGKSGYGFSTLTHLYGKLFYHYVWNRNHPISSGSNKIYRLKTRVRAPKLMVLGGSNCQIHAMKRAAALGMDTVLIDYTPNPPAAALCGLHERSSTFDVPACIRVAKEYEVTGVMTLGTDQPVYTAAAVSQSCGLPSLLSEQRALAVTNKKQMKQVLTEAGIPTAVYRLIGRDSSTDAIKGLHAPFVIKPLDSQGQRGIFKLNSAEEVCRHLEQTLSFSRCQEALVEEYYQSDEITVSGWIKDGCLYILTVTDRLLYPDDIHIGVCTGHRFPSIHMDRYEEIHGLCDRITKAFHLENGPFYLQLLLGDQGFIVNELASRIGGAFEDVFIPEITGFDILQAVIDSAVGKEVSVECLRNYSPDKTGRAAAVQLLFCRPGEIDTITPLEEILALPYIRDAGYNFASGQQVKPVENATARFGHAVICGDKDTIGNLVEDFYRRLSVISTEGGEMIRCL